MLSRSDSCAQVGRGAPRGASAVDEDGLGFRPMAYLLGPPPFERVGHVGVDTHPGSLRRLIVRLLGVFGSGEPGPPDPDYGGPPTPLYDSDCGRAG